MHVRCGGFGLFTPGPGQGGVYSVELTPRTSFKGVQRFRLAGRARRSRRNRARDRARQLRPRAGHLDGNGVHVLRLYRIDVHTHSNLTLRLRAPPPRTSTSSCATSTAR